MSVGPEKSVIDKLEELKSNNKYPVFNDVIDMILKYGVTIEQESFLLV